MDQSLLSGLLEAIMELDGCDVPNYYY